MSIFQLPVGIPRQSNQTPRQPSRCRFLPTVFTFVFIVISAQVFCQNKLVDKANELFKYNQYAQAAELYEQALAEKTATGKAGAVATLNLKSKLAYCYRMNNKMDQAEPLYAEVVQQENAKAENYLYYGEILMGNGKYEEAKRFFHEYQRLEPEDPKGKLMAAACDQVPLIQPYFQYLEIEEFAQNSEADDNAPVAMPGGIVFSSDRQSGMKLMKEKSGWTGRDYLDVYFSEKQPDGSFGEPRQFSAKLSETNKNSGNTSFTADASEVYFTRNDNVLNKQETYSLQLYRASSSGDGDHWKSVEKLPFCAPAYNFMHPAITPDGKHLFFVSNKPGGQGGTDLWVVERMGDDWGKPQNLGTEINTFANEGFPFVDAQGRLYFCSKGRPGYGGFDIFVSEKAPDGNWKTPVNLGKPINSSLDDISIFIAPDRRSGLFTSSRNGGDDDIFLFTVLNEPPVPKVEVVEKQALPAEIETPPSTPEEIPGEEKNEATQVWEPVAEEVNEVEKGSVEEIAPAQKAPAKVWEPVAEQSNEVEKGSGEEVAPAQKRSDQVWKRVAEEPEAMEKDSEEEIAPAQKEPSPEPVQEKKTPPQPAPENTSAEEKQPEPKAQFVENEDERAVFESGKTVENQATPSDRTDHEMPESAPEQTLFSFRQLPQKLATGSLYPGESFRLDGAFFDPNIWQLTPHVVAALDRLIVVLKEYPSLEIELTAHTESLGIDQENLKLSENRAAETLDYLLREGIENHRVTVKGYGENMLLNHCRNGVPCSPDEHLRNQRLEVKVVGN